MMMQKEPIEEKDARKRDLKMEVNMKKWTSEKKIRNELLKASDDIAEAIFKQAKEDIKRDYLEYLDLKNRENVECEYKLFLNGIRTDSYEKYLWKHGKKTLDSFGSRTELLLDYQRFIVDFHAIAKNDMTKNQEMMEVYKFIYGDKEDDESKDE